MPTLICLVASHRLVQHEMNLLLNSRARIERDLGLINEKLERKSDDLCAVSASASASVSVSVSV